MQKPISANFFFVEYLTCDFIFGTRIDESQKDVGCPKREKSE